MKSGKERKAAREAKKLERKSESAGKRWKRRGKRLLIVIGVVVTILLAAAFAMFVSFQAKHSEEAGPHDATIAWEKRAYEESPDGGIPAQEALRENGDELYMSLEGTGWGQAAPDYADQAEAWGASHDGTDAFKIMGAYCANCHTKEELGLYRADASTARAKVMSMVDDYGCDQLTGEQIESLVEFYTE